MALFDISSIEQEAMAEINKERNEAAKKALVRLLRQREDAKQIVVNFDRQIEDLKASITDGSFVS